MVSAVAGVEVGLIGGEFVVNPTRQQKKESALQLTIAGTPAVCTKFIDCVCNALLSWRPVFT